MLVRVVNIPVLGVVEPIVVLLIVPPSTAMFGNTALVIFAVVIFAIPTVALLSKTPYACRLAKPLLFIVPYVVLAVDSVVYCS